MKPCQPRTILMLQGPPCRFWRELGAKLKTAGFRVIHVGFSLADCVFWRGSGQRIYRGSLRAWRAWLAELIEREGVSDVLYYADRQPYHAAAIGVARQAGVRAWAIENGYLRPDWITMEPEAMGSQSRFSRTPEEICEIAAAADAPDLAPIFHHGFAREAVSEVLYHAVMTLGRPAFPNYVADKYYPPLLDYACWLKKWALGGSAVREARRVEAACRRADWPFALLALQLQSDYQIRASSPYRCLSEMLEEVVASFAAHAPADLRLVVKLHPMDNGWENWPAEIGRIASAHRVAGRIHCIDGGSLDLFLSAARGVVTVNSTVGVHALRRHCPVIALGDAIYDMAGLTHQAGLGRFWSEPERPDAGLVSDFVTALAARVQVRGSFYDPRGRVAAIGEIAQRLSEPDRYWALYRPLSDLPDPAEKTASQPSLAAPAFAYD